MTLPSATSSITSTTRLILGPLQCPTAGTLIKTLEQVIVSTVCAQALLLGDTLTAINQGFGANRISWSAYIDQASIIIDQQQRCQHHQAHGMLSGSLRVESLSDDPIHTLDRSSYRDVQHMILAWRLFTPHQPDENYWHTECILPPPPEYPISNEHPYWQQIIDTLPPCIEGLFHQFNITQPPFSLSSLSVFKLAEQQESTIDINALKQDWQQSPHDALLTMLLAQATQHQQQYSDAAKAYQALAQLPQISSALETHAKHLAAQNYALADTPERALELWTHLLTQNPEHPQAALSLALYYEQAQELEKATQFFQHHQQYYPHDLRTFFGLARIYSRQENWPDALEQYKKQLALSPQDAWCLSNLATCELQLGNHEAAIGYLKKARNIDPDGDAGQYAQLILMQFEALDF